MTEPVVVMEMLMPVPVDVLVPLGDIALRWCAGNGFGAPYIVSDGPHYRPDRLTVVAVPEEGT